MWPFIQGQRTHQVPGTHHGQGDFSRLAVVRKRIFSQPPTQHHIQHMAAVALLNQQGAFAIVAHLALPRQHLQAPQMLALNQGVKAETVDVHGCTLVSDAPAMCQPNFLIA
jgi:hypothetical protein